MNRMIAAAARPADCGFDAEPNGNFSVALGSRIARVTVGPGAREGRASYEDSASG